MKYVLLVSLFIALILIQSPLCQTLIIEPDYQPNQFNSDWQDYTSSKYSSSGISLAFSGGGARGLAQIGVLEVLEENDIPVKFIAGTSMGAVIGGLYCSGYSPKELHELVEQINWDELFSSTPIRSSLLVSARGRAEKSLIKIGISKYRPVIPRGITSGQKLSNLLTRLCYRAGVRSSISFDFLNPPFRATATDLITGRLEVISSGDLAEAMRASMSFPIGFTPVVTNGRLFVDGGLINPLPVELCLDLAGGPVIAVNTTTPLLPVEDITDALDMADQSTTVMSLPRLEDQLDLADIVIEPAIGYHKSFDFENIEFLIQEGRRATEAMLPLIRQSLDSRRSTPDKEYNISSIRIVGLSNLPQSYIRCGLEKSNVHNKYSIKNELNSILKTGYVNSARAELTEKSDTCLVTYFVKDNPRIRGFSFTGLTLFSPRTILNHVHSRIGEIANFDTFNEDVKVIEELYAKSGYTLARVRFPQIHQNTGIVSIAVDEGRIQRIDIDGNRRTKDWIILRDFHLKEGDIFTADKAQRSLDDLYAAGLFETVKVTAQPCNAGVALTVKVEEKSFDFLRAGLRYDNEYKSAGFVDLVTANPLGMGNEAFVSGQFGEQKRAYELNIKADRILKTYLTYELSVGHSLFKRNYYIDHEKRGYVKETATGMELEIGQQFRRFGMLSAALNISSHQYQNLGNPVRDDKRLVSLSFRSLVDTYNALPLPETGKYHYFELEFASDVLGGELIYSKFYTSLEAYYPLYHGLNFHPRFELGFFNRTPPYFKMFFLGGRNSFYGLYEHEEAGAKILGASFELRQKITDFLYITGRYDSGKVWNKLESIRFDQLEHGIGGSIVVKTLIGPIGMAYGRTSEGLDAFYFYAGYDY